MGCGHRGRVELRGDKLEGGLGDGSPLFRLGEGGGEDGGVALGAARFCRPRMLRRQGLTQARGSGRDDRNVGQGGLECDQG